jgi:hypothetical protein
MGAEFDTTDDAVDTGAPDETVETSGSDSTAEDTSAGGFNEAWKPYEDALGGRDNFSFRQIQPLLAENDRRVNQRFQAIRDEYKPLEQYRDLGVDAARIKEVMPIVDMLDSDPVHFYELLIQHPAVAEKLAQGQTPTTDDLNTESEQDDVDPQFKELQEKVNQFEQYFAQQAQEQQKAQADAELNAEISTFRAKRPDLTDADMTVLFNTVAGQYQATGNLMSFDEAAKQLDAYRDSLRAPRPGSQAPLVMPTNGGAPSVNSAPKLGDLTPKQTQNLFAELLKNDANINPR